ncbi:hypothetical protein HWV62_7419 [Athelia sp. TMB]|nr:hypothetical protein HWV62_7419 [Athelia sp. TMB]
MAANQKVLGTISSWPQTNLCAWEPPRFHQQRDMVASYAVGSGVCGDISVRQVPFVPYGDQSKRQRKYMQQALGPASIREYQPLITVETASFLDRLLDDPEDYINLIRRYAGSLMLFVTYGHRVTSADDAFLSMATTCISLLSNQIASPGSIWAVDIVPALRHLPSWLPGMSWKRHAKVWKAQIEELVDAPFEFAQGLIRKGIAMPSFCQTLLADGGKSLTLQQLFDIKWTANSMYAGSIDTATTLVQHFIHAMITHPDVLACAQAEIDAVVGRDRLPSFADRAALPYIECVMSECLRWAAPVPVGLPHQLTQDDVYNGMLIPKGALVFGNICTLYPDPDVFSPERFMNPGLDPDLARRKDPRQYVYGFGRRYVLVLILS